jgi:hypothetical protein
VQLLSDLIEKWENTPFGTIIYLKDPELPQILVQHKPLRLSMDAKTQLSCEVAFLFSEELDRQRIELYRTVTGMSCKLSWVRQGLFTREPKFISSDIINKLKDLIPDFRVSDMLSNSLNHSETIRNMIKRIKPDELNITAIPILKSSRTEQTMNQWEVSKQGPQNILSTLLTAYYNPSGIVWNISIAKLLYLTSQRKDLIEMISMLKILSNYLVEFTQNI